MRPADSALASSPPLVVAPPPKPVGSLPADVGDLAQFTQVSATTWWATVVGNLTDETFVVRTVDSGRTWQDVTPPVDALRSNDDPVSDVLSAQTAWLEAATSDSEAPIPLYRTRDGGQSWQDIGSVPVECDLQFVDLVHGWCWTLGGAAGSMGVGLYGTSDGGATWRLLSRTTGDGTPSTVGALPFGCDKSLVFTSPTVGWASSLLQRRSSLSRHQHRWRRAVAASAGGAIAPQQRWRRFQPAGCGRRGYRRRGPRRGPRHRDQHQHRRRTVLAHASTPRGDVRAVLERRSHRPESLARNRWQRDHVHG